MIGLVIGFIFGLICGIYHEPIVAWYRRQTFWIHRLWFNICDTYRTFQRIEHYYTFVVIFLGYMMASFWVTFFLVM